MVPDRFSEHSSAFRWPQTEYLLLNNFFFAHCGAHRHLFTTAAGMPVLPRICAPPGSLGGLLLLSPHPLLLLLPRLHPVLLGRPRGSRGGVQLPRPLPLCVIRVLLWAHWMFGVLSWLLWDLPSQLSVGSCQKLWHLYIISLFWMKMCRSTEPKLTVIHSDLTSRCSRLCNGDLSGLLSLCSSFFWHLFCSVSPTLLHVFHLILLSQRPSFCC